MDTLFRTVCSYSRPGDNATCRSCLKLLQIKSAADMTVVAMKPDRALSLTSTIYTAGLVLPDAVDSTRQSMRPESTVQMMYMMYCLHGSMQVLSTGLTHRMHAPLPPLSQEGNHCSLEAVVVELSEQISLIVGSTSSKRPPCQC